MARKILLLAICLATLAVAQANMPPVAEPAANDPIVYVTKTGKKYHENHCRYLDHSKRALSLSAATKKYTPCKVCRPAS